MEYSTHISGNPKMLRLGGLIFLLVGLVFFLIGAIFLAYERKTEQTYVETEGIITGFDRDDHPYVTYTVDGRIYEHRSNYTSSSLRTGQTMTIRYDPADPDKMDVGGAMALFLPILFMGMGGLFLLIGVLWLWFLRPRPDPDENPWARQES